jgi:hypothetical protein
MRWFSFIFKFISFNTFINSKISEEVQNTFIFEDSCLMVCCATLSGESLRSF